MSDTDQIKVGKFIASCRKEQGMTQAVLAEKLGISDRAVSKWETGKSMPDSGIMLELCALLNINVNELLSGEKIMAESYNKQAEENLLALKQENEENARRTLRAETCIIVITLITSITLLAAGVITAARNGENDPLGIALSIAGTIIVIPGALFGVRIEQKTGYYECAECGNRYKPESFWKVTWAPHIGTTRKMKCPKCGKKSWQKKVINPK